MPKIIRPTISETYLERVKLTPNVVGFQHRVPGSENTRQVTFHEFNKECEQVSHGLMNELVGAGDRVVLISNTRYEWALIDMAIIGARAITVPIYPSNSPSDVAYIVNHCSARVVIVEDIKQLDKLIEKQEVLKELETAVLIDSSAAVTVSKDSLPFDILTLDELKERGIDHSGKNPGLFKDNLSAAKPDDLFTIGYTSGTTGTPKGAMLTHANMMSVIEDAGAVLGENLWSEGEILVTFLPFSHILGRVEEMCTYAFGWRECYAESLEKLIDTLAEVKPTMLFAVPRIFEKAHAKISSTIDNSNGLKRKLANWAFSSGRKYFGPIWKGQRSSIIDYAIYKLAHTIVLQKINKKFGGRVKFAICGGAPLPRDVGEFFQIIGLKILEGYGLTETCAPVAFNAVETVRFGSVGRPLADVQVRVAEDGELAIKSRKVFRGYYKMPAETADVLRDQWFYTGDIGFLDNEGFLHITDRKKDIIITSGGKNVAPQKIENLAKSFPMITQFVVHGDRRNYLTAIITLDRAQVTNFAATQGLDYSAYANLLKDERILSKVQNMIDEINGQLASFETIKKFCIVADEFGIETGELTPSLKVKRNVIGQKYQAELDALYTS